MRWWGYGGQARDWMERRPVPAVCTTAGLTKSFGLLPHDLATPHKSMKECISRIRAAPKVWWAAARGQWFEHWPLQAQFRHADWLPWNLGMAAVAVPGPV